MRPKDERVAEIPVHSRGFLRDGASRTRTGDLLGAISRTRAESRCSKFSRGALSSGEFAPLCSFCYPTWYLGVREEAEREAEGDATVTCGSPAPLGEPSTHPDLS